MISKDSSIPVPGAVPQGSDDLDFVNLVLMLGTTANIELGERGPKGQQKAQDLPRARQLVNMLMALQRKTVGQRTAQEDQVLRNVLRDLQEKYVKASGFSGVKQAVNTWAASQYQKNQK
jgi:hypothetical protein